MTTPEFAEIVPCEIWTLQKLIDRHLLPPPPKIARVYGGRKRVGFDWSEEMLPQVRALIASGSQRKRAGGLRGSTLARDAGRRHVCRRGLRYRDGEQRLCVLSAEECDACLVRLSVESVASRAGSMAGAVVNVGQGR